MPRFVIQEHSKADSKHWDFMLEQGDRLITWQVAAEPNSWGDEPIPCSRIFDHRLKYLTYEGPLGESRGMVKIADRGEYHLTSSEENLWRIKLRGDNINGDVELTRIDGEIWEMTLQRL